MLEQIFYRSTRDDQLELTAAEAILQGLSKEGGLFIPERLPNLPVPLDHLGSLSYQETAYLILREFYTDFTEDELRYCIESAYDKKFDTDQIAPVKEVEGTYYLELFHGPTIAFKDMALSILPYLMTTAAKKCQVKEEIVILTATSGDTGKAAMAGFCDVPGTRIIVFYPEGGVSPIQERQMLTQKGQNVHVIGVKGNFDDCQSGVKALFSDSKLKEELNKAGFRFSSANSINIGRLFPQVAYYVYAYGRLLNQHAILPGDLINVVVPTGNFGNILAAYYAKQMGLPIGKLICASNENKVLVDFFATGVYDKKREFILTTSPSMDILISSNLERLIYEICGRDGKETSKLMDALKVSGSYEITGNMQKMLSDFYSSYATMEETNAAVRNVFLKSGYVIDPHTAVASHVYETYKRENEDETKTLLVSTASPYKFTKSVMTAIDKAYESQDDMELVDELCRLSTVVIPEAIEEIRQAAVIHKTVCEVDDMKKIVEDILKA